MPDHLFADAELAALYDSFCAGRQDFDYYLKLVMADARKRTDPASEK